MLVLLNLVVEHIVLKEIFCNNVNYVQENMLHLYVAYNYTYINKKKSSSKVNHQSGSELF